MARVRAGVVLAAGGSTRMGAHKALLDLWGRPVVVWHCTRLGAFADHILVVVGSGGDAIRAVLPAGVGVVENVDWATTTQIDSLALALRALAIDGPVLVTPVDTPPAEPETLTALLAGGGPAVPVDRDGNAGHPVLLDRDSVAAIRGSPPDGGLRTVLSSARRVPVGDPLVAHDFDDPAAWQLVSTRWAARNG